MRLRPFILCFYRTAFTVQKSGLKSSVFHSKLFSQISPKSYRHNAVSNRFSSRFSTSRTNGPRLPSLPKAGTHSPFGKRSHTRAHTAKQGHSLPRPQRCFVPPAKSLLFHRAFIYIHFPVLCEPSTPAEEKNPAKLPPQRCSQPLFIAFFNFSHKRPTFAFTGESGYTHSALGERLHTRAHTAKQGPSGRGRYHYPRHVLHVHEHPRAGCQNGVLCRFWVLAGGALEKRREPAGQRCVYARRCPEASRPRWAA